ncbi:YobA family protein [Rossellomorea sp. SC111]|jgi:hypothetical protein|uniref:YobA family protein n=1 Tax=Rossellomorea sp. SC111 TaxID=2968985 RepID=UPI00215ADF31|nr:YobA family protein [Rossellomorea sp. SC111]MCR8849359.1 YobA family protein [Rossellomorea sp. SC111]
MKKIGYFILIVTLLLLSCEKQELIDDHISDKKIIHGKVLEKRNQGMTLELTGESKKRYSEKIHVSVPDKKMLEPIEEGQNISVWFDIIRESNPPQTKALKVEIIVTPN